MRKALEALGSDERHTFTGVFERFGKKKAFKGGYLTTILLLDIRYQGNQVTEHLWFNSTKQFDKANLEKGDVVQFDARVEMYEKGYAGWRDEDWVDHHPIEDDYKLARPTKVKVISRAKTEG